MGTKGSEHIGGFVFWRNADAKFLSFYFGKTALLSRSGAVIICDRTGV